MITTGGAFADFQKPARESPCGVSTSPTLHENVENEAPLIDKAPERRAYPQQTDIVDKTSMF